MEFNGLGTSLSDLARLSKAKSRAISMENVTGEKGKGSAAAEGTGRECARDLGRGWKISPSCVVKAGETFVMADYRGQGAIEHIWLTCHNSKWFGAYTGTAKPRRPWKCPWATFSATAGANAST